MSVHHASIDAIHLIDPICKIKLFLKFFLDLNHVLQLVVIQRFAVELRQTLRSPDHILDLPSIDLGLRQTFVPFFIYLYILLSQFVEEILPDLFARTDGEIVILKRDVDARFKGIIEGIHSVRSQEQDAFVVLQDAEEDRDKRISFHVVQTAALQEDVGFINEEHSFPSAGHIKDSAQTLI